MLQADPSDEMRALGDAAFGVLNAEDFDALGSDGGGCAVPSMVAEAEGAIFQGHEGIDGKLSGVPVEQTIWQAATVAGG